MRMRRIAHRKLDIKDPRTGEQVQLTYRDMYWYRRDRRRFFRRLRRRLGLPEPSRPLGPSELVFYWDDHIPDRRIRVFKVRD